MNPGKSITILSECNCSSMLLRLPYIFAEGHKECGYTNIDNIITFLSIWCS